MDKDSNKIGRKIEPPKSKPEIEPRNKETMGTVTMTPRLQNSGLGMGISLPSLQETIPEFFSHQPLPYDRKPLMTSMPRRFSGKASPGPSSTISDSSTVSDSAEREREKERDRKGFGYPQYTSPYPVGNQRRLSAISMTSQLENNHLPPVASLTSSRGSSFELDQAERLPPPSSLQPIFNHHGSHSQPSLHSIHNRSLYDQEYQRPYSSQGYKYSQPPELPRQYRAPPSPTAHYLGQPPPPTYSDSYSHSRGGYLSRPSLDRSPFSTSSHHPRLDIGIDQYEQPTRPGKRRRGNLPRGVTDILRQWLNEHVQHPYPTEEEKQNLMVITGLTMNQISNWFINARRRRLPPRSDESRNGTSSATGSPRPIGGLLPYPPSHSR